MLEQTAPSATPIGDFHLAARQRLADRHRDLMDKILRENSHKKKYWILGMVKARRRKGKTVLTPTLKAYTIQPDLKKEAYLYEVDNTKGTRELVWVMHPGDVLNLPTVGKSIRVTGVSDGFNNPATEATVEN